MDREPPIREHKVHTTTKKKQIARSWGVAPLQKGGGFVKRGVRKTKVVGLKIGKKNNPGGKKRVGVRKNI